MWKLFITLLILIIALNTCAISDSLHRMENRLGTTEDLIKQLEGLAK